MGANQGDDGVTSTGGSGEGGGAGAHTGGSKFETSSGWSIPGNTFQVGKEF